MPGSSGFSLSVPAELLLLWQRGLADGLCAGFVVLAYVVFGRIQCACTLGLG